jgi:hypothetical protein
MIAECASSHQHLIAEPTLIVSRGGDQMPGRGASSA